MFRAVLKGTSGSVGARFAVSNSLIVRSCSQWRRADLFIWVSIGVSLICPRAVQEDRILAPGSRELPPLHSANMRTLLSIFSEFARARCHVTSDFTIADL